MKIIAILLLALHCVFLDFARAQKFDHLAQTPPMGWNTWNTFATHISEDLVKATAEAMVANGMRDAGYSYIVLDDAWSARERDAEGNLIADPQKFPGGMKALGDFLHARGFKFGIYNCAGTKTCAGYPGGRGHEFQDARLYASWGVDYLKYDWCNHGTADARETYKTMRDALRAAGRPIVFSLCEWGSNKPWEWAADVGHLWRTTGDITAAYDGKRGGSLGWKQILDKQVGLERYAGPGHWNDPDMLEVGRKGLTPAESRAHFSLWCMLAAPLMAGNDLTQMDEPTRAVLTNKEVVALDQDTLGKQGARFRADPQSEIWVKELAKGEWAVCVLNAQNTPADVSVDWAQMSFLPGGTTYKVRDLWKGADAGTTKDAYPAARVEAHDVLLFRLTPADAPAVPSAAAAATTPPPSQPASPENLPGKGLMQHPFLYAGEWDYRKPTQTMFIVREGKVVWSYGFPIKDADGTLAELGDATLLSNGNVIFSRKTGASEVTPNKTIVWNYDAPKGTEVHVAQPLGLDRVLLAQNGNPAKLMIVNTVNGQTEKELVIPARDPAHPHGQLRRARMTKAGTFLVAHMGSDKVSEYDMEGKETWSVAAVSPWSAVRLKSGNTLISSNKGFVREVNPAGEAVWEFTQNDVPDIQLFNLQEVNRLANGNTVICNWCPNGIKDPKDWPGSVQVLEVTPEKKVVWALRSWADPADFGPATAIQLLDEPGVAENLELQR